MNTILASAAKWLRDNPQRHIASSLFKDQNGNCMDTDTVSDPQNDKRICGMCALGAIAYQANVNLSALAEERPDADPYLAIIKAAMPELADDVASSLASTIYELNDAGAYKRPTSDVCPDARLGNPNVITLINDLVKQEYLK